MRGFTLIELMVATAILASFLALGIPKMQSMVERHHMKTTSNTLKRTLVRARELAQTQLSHITICPILGRECHSNWDLPIHVFNDANLNNHLDLEEHLFFITDIQSNTGYWQKSRANQNFVRFNPLGHAFSSASTFLLCPHSGHLDLAKSLVINFQGRIKSEQYLNNQGNPYAKFSNLNCE